MQDPRIADPADVIIAWEAIEELLTAVPDGPSKDVLRMVAAGLDSEEIAARMQLALDDVDTLVARARIRILTAAVVQDSKVPGVETG